MNGKIKTLTDMEARKFWCHYIGNDGNTPKRRSIELTDIHELLPQVSNEGAKTPVWYETEEQDYGRKYYHLYAQLSDKVAVLIVGMGIGSQNVERVNLTDEEITDRHKKWLENYLANYFDAKYDTEESLKRRMADGIESDKRLRSNVLGQIAICQNYDNVLLAARHIPAATIKAYEEVQSPILSGLKEIRRMSLERREEERRQEAEQRRKREEEEARKKAEEEAKESERLMEEATKFRDGKSISGCDVVELCRRCSIDIHLRTVHNLQQVIVTINGKEGTCQYYRQPKGKRRPQLDGCYEVAGKLYHHLQEHYDELVNYMKACNKAA